MIMSMILFTYGLKVKYGEKIMSDIDFYNLKFEPEVQRGDTFYCV